MGPIALAILGFIYPFVTYLATWMNSNLDWQKVEIGWAGACSLFPVDIITYSVSAILFVQVALIVPIRFGNIKNAIYVLSVSFLNVASIGGWFILIAYLYLMCKPVNYSDAILVPSIVIFFVTSIFFFLLYWKTRLDEIIQLNNNVFDFEKMRFYMLRPMVRFDGEDSRNVVKYFVIAGVISALALTSYKIEGIGLFLLFLFAGYIVIGVFSINGLYLIWVVIKKNKETGRTMLVAELCRKNE